MPTAVAAWQAMHAAHSVALFVGGATYVWYTAATSLALTLADQGAQAQLMLMVPSAILLGAGAATLWTSQGYAPSLHTSCTSARCSA